MDDSIYNNSRCLDLTAYKAMKEVQREEKRQIISEIKEVAKKHGYAIVSTIKLKEMECDFNG